MRKSTLVISMAIAASAAPCSVVAKKNVDKEAKKPNIILIITDQQRFDCLGIAGNSVIKTPNIDAIARDGVRFTNGYSSCPSSTPARAGLLTGLSPWHHGMLGYFKLAKEYKYEMPTMLSGAGYSTFAIGKLHYDLQRNLHGFDGALLDESGRVESPGFVSDYRVWFAKEAPGVNPDTTGIGWNDHRGGVYLLDEKLHPTTWTAEQSVKYIADYNSPKPMMLKVSFARPHSPYDPPQRYFDMYKDAPVEEPWIGEWAMPFSGMQNTADAAFGDFGINHALNSRRHYYAAITFIDDKVGEIILELKKRDMYDNSVIIFTSDHGDMMGDHYHWRKTYPYEGSARVPFIVKYPKSTKLLCKKGAVDYGAVELRDVLPTFLDVAGLPVPSDMDGKSLLQYATDKDYKWREYIDLEHATCYGPDNYWCALTDGKIKYIWNLHNGTETLFDLEADPHEIIDQSKNALYSVKIALWRKRMVDHLTERGETFVKDGELQTVSKTVLLSPNYPRN